MSSEAPKFRRIDTTPETTQIVVPYDERPNPALRMPHLSLFPQELRHWRKVHDQATKDNDLLLTLVAVRLQNEMRFASRDAVKIRMAAQAGHTLERQGLINWYNRTTKYLAWSRMWQETMASVVMHPLQDAETTTEAAAGREFLPDWNPDPDTVLPEILVEQADSEPRCGVQVVPAAFRRLFDIDAPDEQTAWLEGNDVFVETTRPAVPGVIVEAKYQVRGDDFPAEEYVTARPFLKSEVWQSYIDLPDL